jgi:hypothetical protein
MRKHQEEKGVVLQSPIAGAVAASHGGWLFWGHPASDININTRFSLVKRFFKFLTKNRHK